MGRRGLWNAVENFTSMTWSGSAFIGGVLADSHDYRFTFLITAFVYAFGCTIYSSLLLIVPRKEEAVREVSAAAPQAFALVAVLRERSLTSRRALGGRKRSNPVVFEGALVTCWF